MPRVSIIIPVYNAEKYLRQCLDSILLQTYTDWECILVNDGSQDCSGNICDEFEKKDHRFVVIHKENEGVSCARNSGLDISKGEWLVFIDSDDYIQKDYLHDLAECIIHDVDFVFTGYTIFHDNQVIRKARYKYGVYSTDEKKDVVSVILSSGTPWAKVYKNEIVKKYGLKFDKHLSISEDRMFLYDYLPYVKSVCISDKTDYYYRQNLNSISFTKRKPTEYIYRQDVLGNKAIKVRDSWQLTIKQFLPFIIAHFHFVNDSIGRSGIQYMLDNSTIINTVDYFGINKLSFVQRVYFYCKIGVKNALIYNRRWSLLRMFSKIKNTK